ncbi:hypothetical protein ACOSOMT5_P1825 [Acidiphilium sp. MT5]
MTADQRITIEFGEFGEFGGKLRADDAVLIAGDAPAPVVAAVERFSTGPARGHKRGCYCCAPRNQAALALNRLFLARARGTVPWFKRLIFIGDEAAQAELRAALADDVLSRARFVLTDRDVTFC